jgi:KDO2-lipid IV(A) lauroyltransferase
VANKTSAQIWFEYAAARAIIGVLSILPRRAAIWLGVSVGRLAYHLLGRLRRIGLRNLELAFPEKTEAERTLILKAAFRNLGRVMATVSHFGELNAGNIDELIEYNVDPAFVAEYEQMKTDGRGRILLGGHLGNWELQAFSYSILFEPISFLARKMDNPRIEEMILAIRTRFGNKQIDKTNSASEILRVLRSGGTIGVLADVNSHPKEGVFVPFFGIPACTAGGIAMLAIRTNSVIVPVFAIWDETRSKYFMAHDQIIEPVNSGDRKRDIEDVTALFVAATERIIRAYPEQWIWIHRRWKTRPPGEKALY